jgi:hypothetical protein
MIYLPLYVALVASSADCVSGGFHFSRRWKRSYVEIWGPGVIDEFAPVLHLTFSFQPIKSL